MATKIRVHKLAKELGLTNAECIDICNGLGIDVKSHSSSMEEPQADRVRRKAEREGLIKEVPIEKEVKPKKPVAKKAAAPKTTAKKEPIPKKEPAPPKLARPKAPPTKKVEEKEARPPVSEKKPPQKPKVGTNIPRASSGKPIPPPPPRGSAKSPRRPGPRIRPDVVLPSSGRLSSLSTKADKEAAEKSGQRQQPPYQPRHRRAGRRRRRAPLEELKPVGEPEYTPSDANVPSGTILVERGITPLDLAPKLNRTAADIVKYFFDQGESITANVPLTDEFIELYSLDLGVAVNIVDPGEEEETELQEMLEAQKIPEDQAVTRSPIVTVMGHVDHGKTQLLDTIRNSNVVSGEKGGITQHIGAYKVKHKDSEITFIDTPGHEAFTAMRARGASVTDIVVLVVAADDGVMPQTIEAINHAKSAKTPIIVAINKIDLENKNINRALQQLTEQGLVPESYGGDVQVVEVSAKEATGIDELLESISLIAELEDLKTTFEGRANGVILESQLNTGQGPVATFLVYQGTLSVGDPVVAGSAWGKVKALINDQGEKIKEAYPSMPIQVLGLSHAPQAGTDFACAPNETIASKVAEKRETLQRGVNLSRTATGTSMEDIFANIQSGDAITLNLIIKADTFGSLEAVCDRLMALNIENLKVAYVHKGVGGMTENDVQLALASNATIIGFNIRPDKRIRDLAQEENVEIKTYEIIYKLVEEIEDILQGLIVPEFEEVVTGEAEVREVFHIKGVGYVAGCVVQSGKITSGSGVRFLRDGAIIWKGEIKTLKRFSDDAKEVLAGNECGIGLSDFQDLKPNDTIETYEDKQIAGKPKNE